MEIKILKPCIVDGENVKPSKKGMTVSKKTGNILVGLGLAEDLTPPPEVVELNLTIDPQLLKKAEAEIVALKEENEALKEENEALKQPNIPIEIEKEEVK